MRILTSITSIGLPLLLAVSLGCSQTSEVEPTGTQPAPTGAPAAAPNASNASNASNAAAGAAQASTENWSDGDTIPSGMPGVPDIKILTVHKNGSGAACGVGKTASLKYKAMKADGTVLDPGTRPFSFQVGSGQAIKGWDVIVQKMRVGDSFTLTVPQQLAYGPAKGDLKFDMELLSVR